MAEPPHDEGGGNGEQQAVMPALVAGIHVLKAGSPQDVDGRNKSGRVDRSDSFETETSIGA